MGLVDLFENVVENMFDSTEPHYLRLKSLAQEWNVHQQGFSAIALCNAETLMNEFGISANTWHDLAKNMTCLFNEELEKWVFWNWKESIFLAPENWDDARRVKARGASLHLPKLKNTDEICINSGLDLELVKTLRWLKSHREEWLILTIQQIAMRLYGEKGDQEINRVQRLLASGGLPNFKTTTKGEFEVSEAALKRLEQPQSNGASGELVEATPNDVREDESTVQKKYHDPDNQKRNEWFYKRASEGATYDEIIEELSTICAKKNWNHVETHPPVRAGIKSIAKFHGWPEIAKTPGRRKKPK